MTSYGLIPSTLIDFPGEVAATVFTSGCNLRCPYCHNPELLEGRPGPEFIGERELMAFLRRRRPVLGGVVLSGGEPLLQPSLQALAAEIKTLGYQIKLDTNGLVPEALRTFIEQGLVDYVAMDLKTLPARYAELAASEGTARRAQAALAESLAILEGAEVARELRSTVDPALICEQDFTELGQIADKILGQGRGNFRVSVLRSVRTLTGTYTARDEVASASLAHRLADFLEQRGIHCIGLN